MIFDHLPPVPCVGSRKDEIVAFSPSRHCNSLIEWPDFHKNEQIRDFVINVSGKIIFRCAMHCMDQNKHSSLKWIVVVFLKLCCHRVENICFFRNSVKCLCKCPIKIAILISHQGRWILKNVLLISPYNNQPCYRAGILLLVE